LTNKLRSDELLPLGRRIRTRLVMEHSDGEVLMVCLNLSFFHVSAKRLSM
jgi:hypothetical protein